MTHHDRMLDPGLAREVESAIAEGYAILGLDRRATTPEDALQALREAIACQRAAQPPLDDEEIADLAVSLGCVWGDVLVQTLGRIWALRTIDGIEAFAVVSPDGSEVVRPLEAIRDELRKPPGSPLTGLMLDGQPAP